MKGEAVAFGEEADLKAESRVLGELIVWLRRLGHRRQFDECCSAKCDLS